MKLTLILVGILVFVSTSQAAPSRKVAESFIKELEASVKTSDKILRDGNTQVLHDHSVRMRELNMKGHKLFTPAAPPTGTCSFASASAQKLWTHQLQQFQAPSKIGSDFIKRSLEDYRDNLSACKESLVNFK